MQKRFLKLLAAGVITVVVGTGVVTAHASEVTMEDTSGPVLSVPNAPGTVEMLDGVQTDGNANADNMSGPKITTAKDKFLLEVGQPFNFEKALGLKIVDANDGDMTNKLKIPTISTATPQKITRTIKASNNKGETSSKVITINIIKVAKSAPVKTKAEVQGYDLDKLVTGDTSDLTISLASIDPDNHQFTIAITDGVNTLNKKIDMASSPTSSKQNAATDTSAKGNTSEQASGENKDGQTADGTEQTSTDMKEQGSEDANAKESKDGSQSNAEGQTTDGKTAQAPKAISSDMKEQGGSSNSTGKLPKTGAMVTGVGGVLGVIGVTSVKLLARRRK